MYAMSICRVFLFSHLTSMTQHTCHHHAFPSGSNISLCNLTPSSIKGSTDSHDFTSNVNVEIITTFSFINPFLYSFEEIYGEEIGQWHPRKSNCCMRGNARLFSSSPEEMYQEKGSCLKFSTPKKGLFPLRWCRCS